MFLRLYQLDARGWGGVTVGDFCMILRGGGANIRILRTDLAGPLEEEEVKLEVCHRSCIYMKTDKFLRNRLFCSGEEFVLWG
jgi:hypothetical protein